ncbi:MAG: hypothetical protein J6V92_09015, partial [Bacteroidaceae bacterium]|nr:hypothetical protein [Bacteroidaceae bacterium]
MKKRLLAVLLSLSTLHIATAMPAQPGTWRTITLTDGRQVTALLCGDERFNFFSTSDGACYLFDPETHAYAITDQAGLQAQAMLALDRARPLRVRQAANRSDARQSSDRE